MNKKRVAAAIIAFPATIVTGWIVHEGFTPEPIIPVKGDRPTIGHGMTYYPDGTPVTMSDPPITRKQARDYAEEFLENTYGKCVRDSLGNTLISPVEFEVAVNFAGQYGCAAWRSGKFVQALKVGNYLQYCQAFLGYKYMTSDKKLGAGWEPYVTKGKTRYRYDCSTPGNKVCSGVWKRSKERYDMCIADQ